MKSLALPLLLWLPFVACGQKTPDVPRLSGIVNLPGVKEAVFEFVSGPCDGPRQLVLTEGAELWGLKVRKILPDRGAVEVAVEGAAAPMTLMLNAGSNAVTASATTLELSKSSLHSVLELYGQFSGKTLLHWPTLPVASFSLRASTTNRTEAARILQSALAEWQIATVADGDKFTMIVPKDQVPAVKPHAPRSEPLGTAKSPAGEPPSGDIQFQGVMIEQAFDIYAMLIGGRLDRGAPRTTPIQPFIFLHTQSPLSKEEGIYALDTLFGWQGIKMTREADGSVKAVQEPRK